MNKEGIFEELLQLAEVKNITYSCDLYSIFRAQKRSILGFFYNGIRVCGVFCWYDAKGTETERHVDIHSYASEVFGADKLDQVETILSKWNGK